MISAEKYEKISAPFRKNKGRLIKILNKVLTALTYLIYIALVLAMLVIFIAVVAGGQLPTYILDLSERTATDAVLFGGNVTDAVLFGGDAVSADVGVTGVAAIGLLLGRIILVPAIGFVGVTIFRKLCNCKRPYEILDIDPIIIRDKKGQSFPSRHAFSIFMIAMALLYVNIPLGIVFIFLGAVLAVIRVVGGVHFPRDVVAGAVIAVAWGILGFWVLF